MKSVKHLEDISRSLTKHNISSTIESYLNLLREFPSELKGDNIIGKLHHLKRDHLESGPYTGVTYFEAANRIMTDLVILYGSQDILLDDDEFRNVVRLDVDFGNEENGEHDVIGYNQKDEVILVAEAFNTAPSFFQVKKGKSVKRLKTHDCPKRALIYNIDAVTHSYKPKDAEIRHIRVSIPFNV